MTKPPSERHYVRHRPDRPRHAQPGDLRQPRLADGGVSARCCSAPRSARCGDWRAAIFGGRFDMISQRLIEFLQSFPDLILAMAIAMALGAGFGTVIVAIAITRIPFGGRVIRSVVLSLKEMSYVEAARGLGASQAADDAAAHPAAMRGALSDPGDHPSRRRHHHRGGAGFPGRRHPAADADLGQHAGRFAERRSGAAMVAGAVPRRSRSP